MTAGEKDKFLYEALKHCENTLNLLARKEIEKWMGDYVVPMSNFEIGKDDIKAYLDLNL